MDGAKQSRGALQMLLVERLALGEHRGAAMSSFEAIPDSTQVHVDRLLGARLGETQVLSRVAEGRWGTLYRGKQGERPVTVEVLRANVDENIEEARAASAIKCPGIATVLEFGQVPDGRHYRVMDFDGESLDAELQRKGRFTEAETIQALLELATVLQATHAWALTHGRLGPSSVIRSGSTVKLIDFGLAQRGQKVDVDVRALGGLGFALLTGKELEGAPPPMGAGTSELLDRLLRELLEGRIADVTQARRELEALGGGAVPKSTTRSSRLPLFVVAAAVLLLGVGGAWWFTRSTTSEVPTPPSDEISTVDDGEDLEDPDVVEPAEEVAVVPSTVTPDQPTPRPPSSGPRKTSRSTPSATRLQQEIAKLEARLRKQPTRPGDDVNAALFVLNKQRLRLTGSPTEADRRDVAKQLAGWRRSYLR